MNYFYADNEWNIFLQQNRVLKQICRSRGSRLIQSRAWGP